MGKLVQYVSDETRLYLEEDYSTHNLKLMRKDAYATEPEKLGEFRLEKGTLYLVLEDESKLKIVTEVSELRPVAVNKPTTDPNDIPF